MREVPSLRQRIAGKSIPLEVHHSKVFMQILWTLNTF